MDEILNNHEWFNNGKVNQYKLSKFLENLVANELYFDVIHYFELLENNGYESEINDYCKRHYCKALYMLLKQEDSLETCNEYVNKITSNSDQMPLEKEHFNYFVNSIKFLVKKIKSTNNQNYSMIYNQLSKLNPDILSTNQLDLVSSEGKNYVNVSSKELYYTQYIKALIKLEKFDLCIAVSEKALNSIRKWNYENDIWIISRMYYAKCRIANNFDEDIKVYIDFALSKNKWFLYSKVAEVLFRQGDIKKSIHYYAKAIVTAKQNDLDGLVNVLYDFATLIVDLKTELAKKIFALCYQIRDFNGWKINLSLSYHIKFFDIKIEEKIYFKKLQKEVISLTNMTLGEIITYKSDRNFGFIKTLDSKDYYFNGSRKKTTQYKKHRKVYFDIVFDKSGKKEKAINLFFID